MEDREIKTNIIVFMSLIGLFSMVFFVSQTEQNPGLAEKLLYIFSTIILFAYLGAAFMRNITIMTKLALLFSVLSVITILVHLYHIWIPFFLKTISLLLVLLAFSLSLKVYVDKNINQKSAITVIDQTKKPIKKSVRKKSKKKV